jgi:thiamine-phosphate pyrophosphorylase
MTADVARILDANFNRSREALRVMEDYARFVLDDAAGCEVVKRLRHNLADCLRRIPADTLLTCRDTPGDVGTAISAPSELNRTGAPDVFAAAAKRLTESLRTIEEYAKTFDVDLSAAVELLRYRAYDVEQRLSLRGALSARLAAVRLYVLITASLCRRDWLDTAAAVIAGGAGCIQLREKSLSDAEYLGRARDLAVLCRRHGALFIVNDRPDIARLSGADGVHLGQEDMSPADARRIIGADRLIGLSTHTPPQLRTAVEQAPDYIAVGPMFPSATKPQAHVPGPELLSLALGETAIPIVPVGGIAEKNAGMLREAGARCLCLCSAIIAAEDPQEAARCFCSPETSEKDIASSAP